MFEYGTETMWHEVKQLFGISIKYNWNIVYVEYLILILIVICPMTLVLGIVFLNDTISK